MPAAVMNYWFTTAAFTIAYAAPPAAASPPSPPAAALLDEVFIKAANSENSISDHFGASVAIDGETMVVGANHEGSCSTSVVMITDANDWTNDPGPGNNACANSGAAYGTPSV